ncbi:MAG TPA: hypothetical protein VE153_01210, partial [Myxococcus sp.]|nr:hypothetical protein [Myxococcus sp.]
MTPHPKLSLLTLSLCLGLAAPAAAEQPSADAPVEASQQPAVAAPPDLRLYFSSLEIVRYNPLGVETQNRLMLQKRLFDSESMLLRDTFIGAGASLKLNPAGLKVGPLVEFQPVAMFNLRAGYEYVQFFGTFGFLQSYPGADMDYSDDARDLTKDQAYSTAGHHFLVEPTVQAKVKSVVLRSKLGIEYWNVSLRDGGATFYDALLDTLVPGKGWVFTNDTDLLWMSGPWVAGARFTGVFPRYGEGVTTDNSHMRVGPMAAYSFNMSEGTMFNKPTLIVNLAWYLKHPNREGAAP